MFLAAKIKLPGTGRIDGPVIYQVADSAQDLSRQLCSLLDPDGPVQTMDYGLLGAWVQQRFGAQIEVCELDLDTEVAGPGAQPWQLQVFSADPHLDLERVYGRAALDTVDMSQVLHGLDLQAVKVDWLPGVPAWRHAYISAATIFSEQHSDPEWRRQLVDHLMLEADLTFNQDIGVTRLNVEDRELSADLAETFITVKQRNRGVHEIFLAAPQDRLSSLNEMVWENGGNLDETQIRHDLAGLIGQTSRTSGVGLGLTPRDAWRDARHLLPVDGLLPVDMRGQIADAAQAGTLTPAGNLIYADLPPLGRAAQVDRGCQVLRDMAGQPDMWARLPRRDQMAAQTAWRYATAGELPDPPGAPLIGFSTAAQLAWYPAWDTFIETRDKLSDGQIKTLNHRDTIYDPERLRHLTLTRFMIQEAPPVITGEHGTGWLAVATIGEPTSLEEALVRAIGISAACRPDEAVKQAAAGQPIDYQFRDKVARDLRAGMYQENETQKIFQENAPFNFTPGTTDPKPPTL